MAVSVTGTAKGTKSSAPAFSLHGRRKSCSSMNCHASAMRIARRWRQARRPLDLGTATAVAVTSQPCMRAARERRNHMFPVRSQPRLRSPSNSSAICSAVVCWECVGISAQSAHPHTGARSAMQVQIPCMDSCVKQRAHCLTFSSASPLVSMLIAWSPARNTAATVYSSC